MLTGCDKTINKQFKNKLTRYFAGVALIISAFANASDAGWELAKKGDGIVVYTREVEGSKFVEFKGEADVDANLQQCAGLLMSIPDMPKWMFGTKQADLTSSLSDSDRVLYLVQHAPFPLHDRDLYVHNTLTQNADNSVVYAMDLMKDKEIKTSYVHVKKLNSVVTLTPISATKTHVEYRAHVDPAGVVPSWAANLFVTDTPYNTLKDAKEIIKKRGEAVALTSIRNAP